MYDKLPNADSFTIDNYCSGTLREFYIDDDELNSEDAFLGKLRKGHVWDGSGMQDRLESFKLGNGFTYKKIAFYPNSGEVEALVIEDGQTKDISDYFSPKILDYPDLWMDCEGLSLYVGGKKDLIEYPDLFETIKKKVLEYVYESTFDTEGAFVLN